MGIDPKIVADRIGHANMAYTLSIYTNTGRPGRTSGRPKTVAGVLLGSGWTCGACGAAYIGAAPEDGLCPDCGKKDE